MNALEKFYLETNTVVTFLLILSIYLMSALFLNEFLLTEELYYNSFGEQLAYERIQELLLFRSKWEWVQYVITPLILLIKIFLITMCLNTGAMLLRYPIGFKGIFKVVLKTEIVFAIASIINLIVFSLFFEINTIEDTRKLNVFSLINLFGLENLEPWLVYPLGIFNVFEIAYWLVLSAGIMFLIRKRFKEGFNLVLGSYGTGLLIWMMLITFLQLNMV